MEENTDYIGMPGSTSVSLWGGWKQACINGNQLGVQENNGYIGVVYQLGVEAMRARKHVPYQFRVEGRDV